MEEFLMRIGEGWQASSSGEWIECENPYLGKPWARVPRGTSKDAEAAVLAAHEAFSNGPWGRMAPADRGLLLHKLADCMAADAEHLADLEVRDTGKLKAEMFGNMRYLPRWYQYYGGLAAGESHMALLGDGGACGAVADWIPRGGFSEGPSSWKSSSRALPMSLIRGRIMLGTICMNCC